MIMIKKIEKKYKKMNWIEFEEIKKRRWGLQQMIL